MRKEVTQAVPKNVQKYIGCEWGNWAPGARIPINTPLATCQRDLRRQNVYRYIAQAGGLDRDLFGYATAVRRRSDGAMALINGQHRIELVRIVSPATQEVPAQVIEVDDAEFETYASQHFHRINGTAISQLSNEEIFHAEVLAQEPQALYLEQVLQRAGLSCGRVNANRSGYPVKYATFVKCVRLSEDMTCRAAEILIRSFRRVDTDVLHGLVFLFSQPAYQVLAEKESIQGQQFEDWLVNLGTSGLISIDGLKFARYRNGPWQRGIAYGVAKAFGRHQKIKGRTAPAITAIREIWREGWASKDSDVLSEFQ